MLRSTWRGCSLHHPTSSILNKSDVPASVLYVLYRSTVCHMSIIGRRGPLQGGGHGQGAPRADHAAWRIRGSTFPRARRSSTGGHGALPQAIAYPAAPTTRTSLPLYSSSYSRVPFDTAGAQLGPGPSTFFTRQPASQQTDGT